jgi:beta-xylosidase
MGGRGTAPWLYIRLVELDPKTGKRLHPEAKPVNIAINGEASVMIFHDGWYYLLLTHGSCCAGANSSYSIRMGCARKVTGPFLDNMGIDMPRAAASCSRDRAAATSGWGISVCWISATAC